MDSSLFAYCCWENKGETKPKRMSFIIQLVCIGSTNRQIRLLDPLKAQLGLFVELQFDHNICGVEREASCL